MSCCCHVCKELFLCVLLPVVAVFHFDKQSAVNPFRIWEAQIRNARLDTHLFEFNCLLLVSAASVRYMEQPPQFRIAVHIPIRPRHDIDLLCVLTSHCVFHIHLHSPLFCIFRNIHMSDINVCNP